jgi:hypothetical protein
MNKFWDSRNQKAVVKITNSNLASNTDGDTRSNISDVSMLDSDGDSLPDWQEILNGTDSQNKDTDGDGTNDADEVKLNRDPLKAGPDDAKEQKLNTESVSGDNGDAKTISEAVTRKLFSNTVYYSNSGSLTEDNQKNIINDVVKDLETSFRFKEYPIEGLTYILNETPENLKFYGDIFASLQIKIVVSMSKNINKIQKDFGVLADLYQRHADDLFAIKVPRDLAETHIGIVNNFSRTAAVYRAIANEKEDPLSLPIAVKVYTQVTEEQQILLSRVALFLQTHDTIYTDKEAGGYWNLFYKN